jgi:hypothetical protein
MSSSWILRKPEMAGTRKTPRDIIAGGFLDFNRKRAVSSGPRRKYPDQA